MAGGSQARVQTDYLDDSEDTSLLVSITYEFTGVTPLAASNVTYHSFALLYTFLLCDSNRIGLVHVERPMSEYHVGDSNGADGVR